MTTDTEPAGGHWVDAPVFTAYLLETTDHTLADIDLPEQDVDEDPEQLPVSPVDDLTTQFEDNISTSPDLGVAIGLLDLPLAFFSDQYRPRDDDRKDFAAMLRALLYQRAQGSLRRPRVQPIMDGVRGAAPQRRRRGLTLFLGIREVPNVSA